MSGNPEAGSLENLPKAFAVRSITTSDLFASLRAGLADFAAAPVYGLFF
jgi:hypothetical protein